MTLTKELTTIRDVSASRQAVWDVIANGWTYTQWVVGNSRTRAVDANWPEPGSAIKHSVGVWPLVINDKTEVESCTPGAELVLNARLGLFGAARITLRLSDIADGCRIEMIEVPVSGPARLLPDQMALAAVYPRNRECLWRLGALAERLNPSQVK
ncbi:SRPBCC family protein [Mycobacterium sp. TY815]|uniref:SRPBCC family protein n=1 Tax=Mycobacterium sp. TY815 TaxID=3050581 RepID=UPI002740E692|nr:SRPBCC family protein [Mycobacterium sp. TY815]MDP7701461.1 SRPBCC family protein [Mycobacterium sp. TY815]